MRMGIGFLMVWVAVIGSGCASTSVTVGDRPSPTLERIFGPETQMEVTVVGGSQYCGTDGEATRVTLLADAAAVKALLAARSRPLMQGEPLDQPHALIELGARSTGGYGLAVSQTSNRRGSIAVLQITFFEPAPGRIVTQQLTAPCALVRLPKAPWTSVRVMDQAGVLRAIYPETE